MRLTESVVFLKIKATMAILSVNVNKIATLRNSRGADVPNLIKVAIDLERFGAQGITIHPRPDERHIRYQDARDLKKVVQTELNIEGNPIDSFIKLVNEVQPAEQIASRFHRKGEKPCMREHQWV